MSLHGLALNQQRRSSELERLNGRRRLFASLLQRRAETSRLITTLNDALSVAEHHDHTRPTMKEAVEHAFDELMHRHPEHYRLIRQ